MTWWRREKELGLVQSSKAREAYDAGIPTTRIAELLGCTEAQVLFAIEEYRKIRAEIAEWKAIIETEKAKRP